MPLRFIEWARRSAWTLPLAAIAALVIFGINETAYNRSTTALISLAERAKAHIQIQTLWRSLVDAETGQRGYLLTGRSEYLKPYDQSIGNVQRAIDELESYYANDVVVRPVIEDIARSSAEKLSELSTSLALYDEGKHTAWRELLLTDIGRERMENVRAASEKLLAIESGRITVERQDVFNTLRISRIGVNAMTALSLLALFMFLRQTLAFDAVQRQHAEALKAERDHLESEVTRRTADLTDLARHLQTAREDERSHLARELHDELGALLTAAKLDAARLKRGIGAMSPEVEVRLKHLNDTINNGIGLKRRIIEDLRPSSLSNLGLVSALEILTHEYAERSEVKIATELEPVVLTDSAQITVYRLVQEALTNIAKYAAATEITVTLHEQKRAAGKGAVGNGAVSNGAIPNGVDDGALVVVRDNGRGFDTSVKHGSTHGLIGMRYRVESEGGVMRVVSSPGSGTRIEAWVPVAPTALGGGVAVPEGAAGVVAEGAHAAVVSPGDAPSSTTTAD